MYGKISEHVFFQQTTYLYAYTPHDVGIHMGHLLPRHPTAYTWWDAIMVDSQQSTQLRNPHDSSSPVMYTQASRSVILIALDVSCLVTPDLIVHRSVAAVAAALAGHRCVAGHQLAGAGANRSHPQRHELCTE